MSTPEPNQVISISVKNFPQNLLLPNAENPISLEITNLSHKEEHFKFSFKGENLGIEVKPSELKTKLNLLRAKLKR